MQTFSEEAVILRQARIEVPIPSVGSCMLVWVRSILDDFYEASFATQDLGYTLWIVRIADKKVDPIKCALYFSQQECTRINLAGKLKLNKAFIKENIYLAWIKEYKDAEVSKLSNSSDIS